MTKKNVIRTGSKVAKIASRALRNSSSKKIKSLGGSALSNRRKTEK
jgi:hypothetical protein